MNLTWHLIRKDLARSRWALLCWAVGLLYLLYHSRAPEAGNLRDYLQLTALLVVTVIGSGLVVDTMQSDHPTMGNSHWRTLPIAPWRMALAKLALIGAMFVILPVLAIWLRNLTVASSTMRHPSEYGLVALALAAQVFTTAAAATCTRNVLQCLLLWVVLIFGTGTLADFLNRFAPLLRLQSMVRMGMSKVLVVLILSVIVALTVIFNQYLRRRLVTSVVLLLSGAVAAATVGALWGYFYFYSVQ